ncbi:hypothetical protein PbB2_00601 [Candidatus Phycosocius bacilliformis]|uniref:N-acetyltransferase domain-containing protein n=1 Tax=Candidatus Phycosocius bacilliformis TaxID=1445552 RepID=A0A2P2E7B6_9PROT|nr:hypothetical protein [Candidatus Phycosocius bacilliformis]GBF56944.1 hypothetical protein PbB2_00601 [Candidatus Phycosocius bacilliformis]
MDGTSKFTRTILEVRSPMEGRTTLERVARAAADHNMFALSGSRLIEARSLAVGLVGEPVASIETMQWVYDQTKLGLFGVTHAAMDGLADPDDSSPLCGLLGFVPLNQAGDAAVLRDEFDPVAPLPHQVCTPEEEPVSIFGWGVAVTRHDAARLVVNLGLFISEHIMPNADWYARAVTDDGARLLLGKMGWTPLEGTKVGTLRLLSHVKAEAQFRQTRGAA